MPPFEPPLPAEIQQEIEASIDRFRAFFPSYVRLMADQYIPKYRAEITTLARKAHAVGAQSVAEHRDDKITG